MHTRLTFLDVGLVDKPELDETVMDEPALDKRVVTLAGTDSWFVEE